MVIGVGLGGNLEKSALLAKKALLRPLGEEGNLFPTHSTKLEEEILEASKYDWYRATGFGRTGDCIRCSYRSLSNSYCEFAGGCKYPMSCGPPCRGCTVVVLYLHCTCTKRGVTQVTEIKTPLDSEVVDNLKAGDRVSLSGVILTGRDASHKSLVEAYTGGQDLPVDLRGQVIYYVGPCPAKPGKVIGSAGPTTSTAMDPYTPLLIRELGLKV